MIRLWFVMAFCATGWVGDACASPLSDLSSPSQEVRDRAAELIRDQHLYHSTPRAPWDKLSALLKVGEGMKEVLEKIHKRGPGHDIPFDVLFGDLPPTTAVTLPLDESWVISCRFIDSKLVNWEILDEPREILVDPPSGYTGFWRTYRPNGMKGGVRYYKNGKIMGGPAEA